MIIASNHLETIGFPLPEGTVVRLNLAWVKSVEEARQILAGVNHEIYLDFPEGRKKPPRPTITFADALMLAKEFNVKYFAVSNVEGPEDVIDIMKELPGTIIVPKIESETGVRNIPELASVGINVLMFDKEDLYTDIKMDADKFNTLVSLARNLADMCNMELLELQGVIFA